MSDTMEHANKLEVGKRLKEARSKIFGSAKEAADALGMKDVTVRAHESGRNGVSYYDLERYARRYGVAQMWLLTGEGKEVPSADFTSELGELILVEGYLDDEAWFPVTDGPDEDYVRTAEGYAERVAYTDPRFPEGMVGAFKVRSGRTDAPYIDGTIVFCVNNSDFGVRPGDHVIVVRTRDEFDNVSVRQIDVDADGTWLLRSLTTHGPPIRFERSGREEIPHISALVIGSLTRRPAPRLNVEQLKAWESERAAWRKIDEADRQEIAAAYYEGRAAKLSDDTNNIEGG